ncbi:MAG: type IV toxin-antitoxin system AbiEi family antitoxin domain-containing protein [Candidatus Omnitrophica bacterium]|nr:type IV toxin-antitoxin system AbiEi family antitoxin domain-containing protein [Candidatus Omnitrophota bacterium]
MLLDRLHRELQGPFTVAKASRHLELKASRAARLLAYWASRGWLSRLRKGLYVTVPLGAQNPAQWSEDPWIVAHHLFEPCYIGGWSACEHWGLTEQIFREIVVFTTRKVRNHHLTVKETLFLLRVIPPQRLFGTTSVWRQQTKIQVSDPSRTVADLLMDPSIGGGMRFIAEIVGNYFGGEHRNDTALLDFVSRLGNRTIYKRLGYLVETLGITSPEILHACHTNLSKGYSLFDPTAKTKGSIVRRWNLRVNVAVSSAEARST